MRRKLTAFIILFVILVTGLSGCNKEGNKETGLLNNSMKDGQTESSKGKEPTMGRYMEEEITLPELSSNESIIGILENADKQLEAYTFKQGDKNEYFSYRLKEDKTWERSTPGWLNSSEAIKQQNAPYICLGRDGNYYAAFIIYSETEAKSIIIKSEDGGNTARVLKLPYLEKETRSIDTIHYYPSIEKMQVLKNGTLVLYDTWKSDVLNLISEKDGQLDKLSIGEAQNFITSDEDIITVNAEGTGIIYYNPAKGKTIRTIDFDKTERSNAYALKEDGTLVLGDSGGIHRLQNDGTLWETVVDGSLNSMSMPSFYFNTLFIRAGEQEEYYAVYNTGSGPGYALKRYAFDKNVASVPEKEITVYSLTENNTIRQAIALYQSDNPDTKVNYVVAMGEQGGNSSDYIRTLNTELLAGNGADVLVLDGLPVDSYIEKGVLSDLSDIMKPLVQSGEVLPNIMEYYSMDGKVYEMPIRFSIPIIAGKKEAAQAASSTDSIVNYIKETNISYSSAFSCKQLLSDSIALYSGEILSNGELNEDNFSHFLKNLKIIAENEKAIEMEENTEANSRAEQQFPDNLFYGNVVALQKKYATATEQIKNVMDTMLLFEILKNKEITYQTINQMYIPIGAVGLNSKSGEAEIAKKFIGFLFEAKVQDANLYDGFPVNQSSLKTWIAEENPDLMIGIGGDGYDLTAQWPIKEEREAFLATILEVKRPIEVNQILYNMIVEETVPYLKGEAEEEQVVAAVKAKVNTYLAE